MRMATADGLQDQLQEIDPYSFEDVVATVWELRGWETRTTTGSSDRGIDVIAERNGQRQVIQCKRYSDGSKVSAPEVQQMKGALDQHTDADEMVIVTTSEFTDGAFRAATELGIEMIPRDELASMVREVDAEALIEHAAAGHNVDDFSLPEIESESDSASVDSGSESLTYIGWALVIQIVAFWDMADPELMPGVPMTLSAVVFTLLWFAMPALIYKDAQRCHRNGYTFRPNRLTCPLFAMCFPILFPVYYGYKRRQLG